MKMQSERVVRLVLLLLLLMVPLLLVFNLFSGRMPEADGDLLSLLPAHSNEQSAYRRAQTKFGDALFESIRFSTRGLNDDDIAELLYQIEQELTEIAQVRRVISPALEWGRSPMGIRLLDEKRQAMRFLVAVDARLNARQRAQLQADLSQVLQQFSHVAPARSGAFFISESVAAAIISENKRLVPITLLVLTVLSVLQFRNLRLSVYALCPALLAVTLVVLGVTALDKPFGAVSQLAPALLLAVGTVYGIQSQHRIGAGGAQVRAEIRLSLALAALTTALGLGSLWAIDIPAVRDFAVISAVGVLLAGGIAILLLEVSATSEDGHTSAQWPRLGQLSRQRFSPLLILLCPLLLLPGIAQLRIHANPLAFLPEGSSAKQSIEAVQQLFPGNRFLSLHVESERGLAEGDYRALTQYAERLGDQVEVLGVASGADFKPLSEFTAAFSLVERSDEPFGPPFITSTDAKASRILVEHGLEGADLIAFAQQLERNARDELASIGTVYVSGIELMLARQSEAIVRGILEALLTTLLLVAALLLFLFRSLRIVLIGLVPNVIPIIAVFGLLGYWYGELQLAAALVAVSALSIAVDNTFHFLVALREFREVDAALNEVLPAFLASTVVLVSSFLVLALSSVQPVQQFGLLLSCTLVVGLAADAILLPWLLRNTGGLKASSPK